MPVATFESEDRFELKSVEGAYIILRRMSYGQKLERQGAASKMQILMQRNSKDIKGEIDTMILKSTLYDFRICVVSHNLEKKVGDSTVLLDLTQPGDVAVLHPRVGEEIATLIDKMNNFEDDDEVGN